MGVEKAGGEQSLSQHCVPQEQYSNAPLKSFKSSFSAFCCAGSEFTSVFRLRDSIQRRLCR